MNDLVRFSPTWRCCETAVRPALLLLLWRASTQFTVTHHCWSLTVRNAAQWTRFCCDKQGQQVTGSLSVWFCARLTVECSCMSDMLLCLNILSHLCPLQATWDRGAARGPDCDRGDVHAAGVGLTVEAALRGKKHRGFFFKLQLINYAHQWFNENDDT